MAIHIIGPPGPYGGVISGRLEGTIDASCEAVAVFQHRAKGMDLRHSGVPAARLWSCDLGQDQQERVAGWTAVHATAARLGPLQRGREVLAEAHTDPSPLTAFLKAAHRDRLWGKTSSSSGLVFYDSLYLYAWTTHSGATLNPGWKRLENKPIKRSSSGSELWNQHVDMFVQYAVAQFDHDVANELKPPIDAANGILAPKGAQAFALLSTIGIRILSEGDDHLSGVVTGLRCAYDHSTALNPQAPPGPRELLRVVLWAIDDAGSIPLAATCELSGYWKFETVPETWNTAVQFAVALTTREFKPGHMIPVRGGEVIAVETYLRTKYREAVSLPIEYLTVRPSNQSARR